MFQYLKCSAILDVSEKTVFLDLRGRFGVIGFDIDTLFCFVEQAQNSVDTIFGIHAWIVAALVDQDVRGRLD